MLLRFIYEVLSGINFVFPYLDDILIASTNERQHKDHLKIIFERSNSYGLKTNISKSVFGVREIEFLGYLISQEGSRPLPEKVQAIINCKKPETLHDLRTFLGMINFYRRYLKDAAKTQTLLHDYLKEAKKKEIGEKFSGLIKLKNSLKNVRMI
ncbi:transposon Ty3-I Gag-Pol polyprotein [Nephila pilipes]|uniref:Transposon Ty3-I Gag-Pol polyprotein n=1 Tax=Nephila pilipes TaxID=299642 RepID=A0A8X6PMW6_NEPPI|nr:transposon Ty3-I Gag-Pol polyprotein [Nephila pilipes]